MGMKCGHLAQGKTEQILFLINRTRSFALQSVSNLLVLLIECNINAVFKRDTFT